MGRRLYLCLNSHVGAVEEILAEWSESALVHRLRYCVRYRIEGTDRRTGTNPVHLAGHEALSVIRVVSANAHAGNG